MRLEDRRKAERLEAIMARYAAQEQRTLADLHHAGFTFQSIQAAQRRLIAQRTMHGFTQQQLDIAIAVAEEKARRRAA